MGKVELGVALGLVALALVGYAAAKRAGVLPGPDTFNPLSENNLAYRGANVVYQTLTGNTVDTFGTGLASGVSDRAGSAAVTPVQIVDGHAVPPADPQAGLSPYMRALFGLG